MRKTDMALHGGKCPLKVDECEERVDTCKNSGFFFQSTPRHSMQLSQQQLLVALTVKKNYYQRHFVAVIFVVCT